MPRIMGSNPEGNEREEILIANAQQMKENTEANEDYQTRCIEGEKVFYSRDNKGRLPGHIYSALGIDEYKISQMCEYHFDEATLPPDEKEAEESESKDEEEEEAPD